MQDMASTDILFQFLKLTLFDAVLVAVILAAFMPLSKVKHTTFAVMKRNFAGYFGNPTGYVFICVFVFLCSVAAFWSQDFFARNLATLDQLNGWFPYIMLVFVPAITMSIWAEERSEGTDELLLTTPASDFDIVLGKYLAAAAIFSASLLFSQLTNFLVLDSLALGQIDLGLFIATYLGYWLIGLAMLSLGMAASFLTSNLTISFILGALFNAPLVFLNLANRGVADRGVAQSLSWWSIASRFGDFSRGVLGSASVVFFVLIIVFGVYLSMVFISRRHWESDPLRWIHFLLRGIALVAIVFGASRFLGRHDLIRGDITSAKVSSLSSDTKQLLRGIDKDKSVLIEAFISRSVPEQFVKTKVDLISKLREFESLAGANVTVRVNENLEAFSDEATRAEEQYGITPQTVMTQSDGAIRQEELFMGAAFTSGLDRVVVPFFSQGLPVEYELVRSITTVMQSQRKKIGIVHTDARLFGGFDPSRMGQIPKELIVEELEKQFEVEEVDLSQPVNEGVYDALLAVQPSSLTQSQIDNLVAAIRNGTPTAIFEDPMPFLLNVPGTGEPRRPVGGMMGMMGGGQQQPEPKGNIQALWSMLGIDMVGDTAAPGVPGMPGAGVNASVVFQDYNPYEGKVQAASITHEWVFISPGAPPAPLTDAFNSADPVVSDLRQILMLYPGAITPVGARGLTFTPLLKTGDETGTIGAMEARAGMRNPRSMHFARKWTRKRYVTAARIRGRLEDDLGMSDKGATLLAQVEAPTPPSPTEAAATPDEPAADVPAADAGGAGSENRNREIHVAFVSDVDLLHSEFLNLRAQPDSMVPWKFDNVTFVLNILDSLVGDDSLLGVRKRETRYSTLLMVERATDEARQAAQNEIASFEDKFKTAEDEFRQNIEKTQKELQDRIDELRGEGEVNQSDLMKELNKLAIEQQRTKRIMANQVAELEKERERELEKVQHGLEAEVSRVQNEYKMYAALLPPIPPLIVGMIVFMYRRMKERESIGSRHR